ncbi:putative enzyme of poly-gamma-glutamate biosynthesis (capsule formation) [Mycobacterium sp. JS623]|uniref:CapA family protein n=1 Tax=Mycobacterium sp. JS623 TaxID=212767 RepID=UPI0002A59ED4|nr:CapA family protein [Mycobacterium sp. JS623]AGB23814.1 putative enzyme of poly-gamma-glutamate biosynthesis (capsule formation) [Mycobacterium sp. JS623]
MTVIFLTGDVMTGRAIDQLLPHPGDPTLHESVVSDARKYISLAEQVNGPIPTPIDFSWPWGEALEIVDWFAPDVRLLNLETSITARGEFARGKVVHYRMHPDNIGCLTAIRPDVCALANNHILDFGYQGLRDTLKTLDFAGIHSAGAGLDADAAERPVVVGRVVIASCGMNSSGIPPEWAATARRPGVAYVPDMTDRSADMIARRVTAVKGPDGIGVVSVHWGSNWGYAVDNAQIRFAHRLIDAGVDLVHGHSSHHPRPIEAYRGKLILYGCGDTIDDYEGIRTYEAYRHELRLLHFVSIESTDIVLRMMPMRMRRMRLERAPEQDAAWLHANVAEMSRSFGTRVEAEADGVLRVAG